MQIDTTIDKSHKRSIDRLANEQINAIKQELHERYLLNGRPRDFKEIATVFASRPMTFMVDDGKERYVFEEASMRIGWLDPNKLDVPHVSLRYQGRPRELRNLSFFDVLPSPDEEWEID